MAGLVMIQPMHGKGKGDKGGKPNKENKGKGPDKDNKGPDKNDKKPDKKDSGKPDKKDHSKWDADAKGKAKFKDSDRDELSKYFGKYSGNDHGLPPGLAKNVRRGKPLPPGWQKKVQPGWRIDDDSWNDFSRISREYLPKNLSSIADTDYYLYGNRVVRVHKPSREVVDFLDIPSIKIK